MIRRSLCETWGHAWGWPDDRTELSACSQCGATRDGKLNYLPWYLHPTMPPKERGHILPSGYGLPTYDLTPPEEPAMRTQQPTIPASTLTDTALVSILRDCDREVRDSVRLAAADRIDWYRRQIGQLERILQAMDPTIRPQAF